MSSVCNFVKPSLKGANVSAPMLCIRSSSILRHFPIAVIVASCAASTEFIVKCVSVFSPSLIREMRLFSSQLIHHEILSCFKYLARSKKKSMVVELMRGQ